MHLGADLLHLLHIFKLSGPARLFSKQAAPILLLLAMYEHSISPVLFLVVLTKCHMLFLCSHPGWYEVVFHCSFFDLHFPFHVYIDYLYNFFGGMPYSKILWSFKKMGYLSVYDWLQVFLIYSEHKSYINYMIC